MLNKIYFFVDEKGANPVKDFICNLTDKEQAKIAAYVTELKQQGHNLRRPMAGYLGSGIYELRPQSYRVFYFFFMKNTAVLVHAIRKKADKIPREDLALCLKRKMLIRSEQSLEAW